MRNNFIKNKSTNAQEQLKIFTFFIISIDIFY